MTTVEISGEEYAHLVNLCGVSGILLDRMPGDSYERAEEGMRVVVAICSRCDARRREEYDAREREHELERYKAQALGLPPMITAQYDGDGMSNMDALVTLRYRVRERSLWGAFSKERHTLSVARRQVEAYREMILRRATEQSASKHAWHELERGDILALTRPGERVIIGAVGTLTQLRLLGCQ